MPLDVILMHNEVGIIGQALRLKLIEGGMIPGLERLQLALSPGQSLLQA
jgi:hypothetical protein